MEMEQNGKGKMEYLSLMPAVLESANMRRAYGQVMKNKGSAGIDGIKWNEFEQYVKVHWAKTKETLQQGRYQPKAVKGLYIPKPNGGKRLLGIPTLMDRMIQQGISQVFTQIWDKTFSTYSYGFRPNRNAHQALHQAQAYMQEGYTYVIDLDLAQFFDRVNHDKLMGLLRRKVKDQALLRQIRAFLEAGLVLEGNWEAREEGTPQGSPLSPILSNILLDELDKELQQRGHRFVRYADDCSIFLKSRRAAQRVLESITRFIEGKLKLKVNAEKTKIVRPTQFVLLGHTFTSSYRKGSKNDYRLSIAKKSYERLKAKIKIITRKTRPVNLAVRIAELNQLCRGWVNYFQHATGYQKLKDIDGWVRNRLRYCIWKQWKHPKRRKRAFLQLGLSKRQAHMWAYSRKGGWRISCSPIMGQTVTEARLQQRGYQSLLDLYLKLKYPKPKPTKP